MESKEIEKMEHFNEGLLEIQIRERRFQIWNKIQTLYVIPDHIQKAIKYWIELDCNYVPKITRLPIARVVPHGDI